MARGDVVVFDVALEKMIAGDWATTDAFYCAICDDTTTPANTTATPVIGDFTQVGNAGTYVTDGANLGLLSALVSQTANVMTFDSGTNPSWNKDANNDNDAYWGIIYNYTDAGKDALAYVDLGGPVDMSAGNLTITWDANGIFTVNKTP